MTLAATGLLALVFALLFLAPGIVPSFLQQPTEPAQVAAVTPQPTTVKPVSFPTLPPEWTATPSPVPSATPTTQPTATPSATPAASSTLAASRTPGPSATSAEGLPTVTPTTPDNVVKILTQANVRSGPDTDYPILLRLKAGDTAPVLGRDSSSKWFKISAADTPQGAGWVSSLVASYSGDVNALPILTAPPPPVHTPAPTSGPPTATSIPNVGGANGLLTLLFKLRKTTGVVGENMWFDFQVRNTTNTSINNYGILAAHTDQGVTADSWHAPLDPGQTLTWDDHINFPSTGTYQVYLGICYSSHDACKTGGAAWTRLSPSTAVTIQ